MLVLYQSPSWTANLAMSQTSTPGRVVGSCYHQRSFCCCWLLFVEREVLIRSRSFLPRARDGTRDFFELIMVAELSDTVALEFNEALPLFVAVLVRRVAPSEYARDCIAHASCSLDTLDPMSCSISSSSLSSDSAMVRGVDRIEVCVLKCVRGSYMSKLSVNAPGSLPVSLPPSELARIIMLIILSLRMGELCL